MPEEQAAPSETAAPAGAESADRPAALQVGYPLGAPDAPLEVVEFSDFGCSSCAEFATGTLPALRREFVDSGLVRWRYVSIRQGFLRGGEAARAAECAARQDRFWQMHDSLAEGQREWQRRGDPLPVFQDYAERAGMDPASFLTCYESEEVERTLRLHDLVALNFAIRGVPAFFVGRQRVVGALPPEQFARILRRELAARAAP